MADTDPERSDAALAAALARLWPHREHEAGAVRGLLCRVGLHRWRHLDLEQIQPNRDVDYCLWRSKLRIDGQIYDP